MNHASMTTTMTSYGAERVSVGIRRRQLRRLLNEVELKALQGKLQRYVCKTAMAKANKVIQVFSYLRSDVFICVDPTKPTWPGHEEYVDEYCSEFDECLFCRQCRITPDTLPVLVRWQRDIKQMVKLVGPIGISDKVYLRRQAIEEVFDLCRHGKAQWQEALQKAYEVEADPAFAAPDFMYKYTSPREAYGHVRVPETA
jgi:hypothetical protein